MHVQMIRCRGGGPRRNPVEPKGPSVAGEAEVHGTTRVTPDQSGAGRDK